MNIPGIREDLILGLDIGIASVGWALVRQGGEGAEAIEAAGVRVFPTGMDLDERGKAESHNVKRREARLRRRQLDRRAMRKAHVARMLKRNGLAPERDRDAMDWRSFEKIDPYVVRAAGLDRKLEPFELGRALFHLAQRRGFLSNRKAPLSKDEEHGEIIRATGELELQMRDAGSRTLGEFLARLNPREQRRRGRYTLRRWYREEFMRLWDAQASHHPNVLTAELRARMEQALFFQRPLKVKAGSVGFCALRPRHRCCAIALLAAQRFRLLQTVNNLRVEEALGSRERALTPEERKKLVDELARVEKLSFARARTVAGLSRRTTFNLERGGAKGLVGNVTAARIRDAVGSIWDDWSEDQRGRIVNDLLSIEHEDALFRRATTRLGLDEVAAQKLAETALEDGYASLSLEAIRRLLPRLEAGEDYTTAAMGEFSERFQWDSSTAVEVFPDLRNPLVQRPLAEMRRVVNAILRKYGKPGHIRVELARELKQPAKKREESSKRMRAREDLRTEARAKMRQLAEIGIAEPKGYEIEKWLLADECDWRCPYTGKAINAAQLFGEHPQFDVEHIIPFSRSLDDSFANKTLCHVDYNRNVKKNRTPFECAGSTSEWPEVLRRVESFKGAFRDAKLARFLTQDIADEDVAIADFSARDLVTTGYASRAAAAALARLYDHADPKRRVQATHGRATSYLRSAWQLNDILGAGGQKNRDDHRHHLIDATVVALTTPRTVADLARASVRGHAGRFAPIPPPWRSFKEDLRGAVDAAIVSHRVDRSKDGPLHQETHYGLIRDPKTKGARLAVVRKPVSRLSAKEVAKGLIVDKAVREAVETRLKELGVSDPEKAFQTAESLPYLTTRSGRRIPIRRVRVIQGADPVGIESHPGERNVVLGNNHHLEIFETTDRKGNKTWRAEVVSNLEAYHRYRDAKRAKRPVELVRRADEKGSPLVFSLSIGETVEMDVAGVRSLFVVQNLSQDDFVFRRVSDARLARDARADLVRICSGKALRACNCVKYAVDALGSLNRTRD